MKNLYIIIIVVAACLSLAFTLAKSIENASPELKVSIFDGGKIECHQLEYFTHDEAYQNQSKTLSNSVFLIQHPKGNLIWDTGISDSYLKDSSEKPNYDSFKPIIEQSLMHQLEEEGIKPNEINYISLSHTHFDHIGNVSLFKNSIWVVQQDELKWAFTKHNKHERDLISALKDSEKVVFKKRQDVFGDGSVVIYHYPGHTPGHCVLSIKDGDENYIISGDMYHFSEQREHQRIPQFNYDIFASRKSMQLFEKWADSLNAQIVIQHENNFPKHWEIVK